MGRSQSLWVLLGGVWLLDALWRRLGIDEALAGVLGSRQFATDIERVWFAMVANRALDPCSRRACSEWARGDVATAGLDEVGDDHCYRAMDLLVDADTEGKVKEVRVGDGDSAKRFIVCHNPGEADGDKQAREDTLARLEAELARIAAARAKANRAKASAAHHRAECALRDHPTLGRYIRQTKTGRLSPYC